MKAIRCAASAILLVALAAAPAAASAAPRRFALLVGENSGDAEDATLRYAESDAQRLARVLRDMGGFATEDVVALNDVNAEEMRGSLIGLNSRIREAPANSTLFVFYSGHADAESLHLRGTHLKLDEVWSLVHGSPAVARVLVVDACRSGAVTRVKGGHPAAAFAINVDSRLAAEGMAILTSSAAGEDSQESDQIGASFFTHFLVSALMGAADRDGDGRVTLDEAFGYSSERTLVATKGTVSGPQHPTYRFELGGQGALVLTEPGVVRERFGALEFPKSGTFVVQRGTAEGAVVAEISPESGGRRLSVSPGTYFVTRREQDYLLEGKFAVGAGGATRVVARDMHEVAYAQVVRKGGTVRSHTWSAFAAGSARSDLLRTGGAGGLDVGARLDLRPVSFELRFGAAAAHKADGFKTIDSREISGEIAALRGFDTGRFSFGLGGAVGALQLDRGYRLPPPPPGNMGPNVFDLQTLGFYVGPMGSAEVRIWRGMHLRMDAAWLAYTLSVQNPPPAGPQVHEFTEGAIRVTGGLGLFF